MGQKVARYPQAVGDQSFLIMRHDDAHLTSGKQSLDVKKCRIFGTKNNGSVQCTVFYGNIYAKSINVGYAKYNMLKYRLIYGTFSSIRHNQERQIGNNLHPKACWEGTT
jgi:hypothetical protein